MNQSQTQVVFTNRARCRDCYRCIRVCPVHAIGIRDGQAYVDERRCIACGTCIRQCPQQAKTYRRDLAAVLELLRAGGKVAVSVAPSFACLFDDWQIKRLPSALRKLGFAHVAETAVGAYHSAQKTADWVRAHPDRLHIASACPAVANYVLRAKPELADALVPVLSPMLAHAKQMRCTLGPDWKIVFIGPCVAKKAEADAAPEPLVDHVLTFHELAEWLDQENVRLADLEESGFDETPAGLARAYPLEGGSLHTADLPADALSRRVTAVGGIDEIADVLEDAAARREPLFLEPLFCRQGCINGPGLPADKSVFQRKQNLLAYVRNQPPSGEPAPACPVDLACRYEPVPMPADDFTEEQIRRVFDQTGKSSPDDQLNCGACGYATCRDQARAVLRHMAEPDMCVPFIRRLAEQRTDRIIETSPNGILILDEHLRVLHMNPSFRRLFMCSDSVLGRHVSYLMEPRAFEQLTADAQEKVEMTVRHEKYSLICRQILYALREEKQYVGIFVNLTDVIRDKKQYDRLRTETLDRARGLFTQQVEIAGRIAEHLGRSTAESEALLKSLTLLTQQDPGDDNPEAAQWLKDIYTSK